MNSDYIRDIDAAIVALQSGLTIVYPTDTVWGIGCDASCSEAVKRVYALKRRSDSKALITLVADRDMLATYVEGIVDPEILDNVMSDPRPVTVVYPKGINVAPELLAEDGSIGIRIVATGFAHDLCKAFGKPIVSTSANISGMPTPAVYREISSDVLGAADYVAMTGRNNNVSSLPSKIVKLTKEGEIIVLRG